MKIRNILGLVIGALALLLLSPVWSAAQSAGTALPVVTLQQARERAIAIDPVGVAARGAVSAATWARRGAATDLFTPHLSAATSYTTFSEPFFNLGTGEISSAATSATLQASYTVFGRGKFAELKRARAELASAEAGETAATFNIALNIDAAYYAVLVEGELARVAAARLERAEEQLSIARARVNSGSAIASDSLQLLLEVNKARLEQIRRDSAVAVARLTLGRGIGLAGPADAGPIETAQLPPLPITQEQAIAELRARGPGIVAARAAERHAEAMVGVQREAYLPEVTVAATVGAYDSELFPSDRNRSQLLVNVSLPIWNGGQREVAMARARAERDVAKAQRDERERAAAEMMAAALNGYQTARAAHELAQVGVSAATENFRVQRARYREGSTTILDLVEAQVALSEAESARVESRYAAHLALARVEALLGRRLFDHN